MFTGVVCSSFLPCHLQNHRSLLYTQKSLLFRRVTASFDLVPGEDALSSPADISGLGRKSVILYGKQIKANPFAGDLTTNFERLDWKILHYSHTSSLFFSDCYQPDMQSSYLKTGMTSKRCRRTWATPPPASPWTFTVMCLKKCASSPPNGWSSSFGKFPVKPW